MTALDPALRREVVGPSATAAAVDDQAVETAASPSGRRGSRVPGRLVVVAVVVSVILLIVLDILVGRLAFTTRQDHWADLYNDPTLELPERGGPVAVLQVEEAEVNLVVAEGADGDILRGGPGLMSGSPLPGEGGNTVILGRSSRFGGYFGVVKDLPEGTTIILRLRGGAVARYEVDSVTTVKGNDLEVLQPTDEDRLTLITSAGGPFDSRRTVVTAELTGLGGAGATAPATDPDGAASAGDTAASATTTTITTPTTGPDAAAAEEPPDRDPGEVPDSFDVRPPAAPLMLLAGLLIVGLGAVAVAELRRRHPTSTVVVVAGPAIALGVVLVLFNLDALLPVTF